MYVWVVLVSAYLFALLFELTFVWTCASVYGCVCALLWLTFGPTLSLRLRLHPRLDLICVCAFVLVTFGPALSLRLRLHPRLDLICVCAFVLVTFGHARALRLHLCVQPSFGLTLSLLFRFRLRLHLVLSLCFCFHFNLPFAVRSACELMVN